MFIKIMFSSCSLKWSQAIKFQFIKKISQLVDGMLNWKCISCTFKFCPKLWINVVIVTQAYPNMGSSIKDACTNVGIFGTPYLCPGLSTLTTPPPCPCGHKTGIFKTLQLVNNSHWMVKKLIILILDVHKFVFLLENFDNSIPK